MVATSDAVARVRYVSLLTTAAMVAFAANSVLCPAALGDRAIAGPAVREVLRVAGRQGFEPRFYGPEPYVLPLDDLPAEAASPAV